ncbi:S-methyl-5'-thioadenosine phosphorylase [Alicyclobacillus cycloheptanicus]|uniref:Probable 6-oxopurine nucleoside phosphorylase n=1 Tax=Alicyclobacillus cycloheptanicus TaxID=1457 RepID=A0ABT9XE45_9BACL|nr:S-methyl-5'-thioadenosine phosphorylase [Alicyclobacillus cycloheptanicus]MDQ0188575.1 5'-methylthioadenosine phosphorylase [Alicyclobacillus cycloheptanicus]
MQAEFAIIGGTGVYDPALLESPQTIVVDTAYGSVELTVGTYLGRGIAFLPRHGRGHSVPPHRINYRANLMALKQMGVRQVLSTSAVGSLSEQVPPGSLVAVNDFLDFTKSRPTTFFEGNPVVHVDMTDPYCHRLRGALQQTARAQGIELMEGGVYVCAEGPRFETPAEIRYYQSIGGAVVGMTNVPEVVLAKEAELCYATVCIVTNFAAGISPHPLTHEEVVAAMAANSHRVRQLFFDTIASLDTQRDCRCGTAVHGDTPLLGAEKEGGADEGH